MTRARYAALIPLPGLYNCQVAAPEDRSRGRGVSQTKRRRRMPCDGHPGGAGGAGVYGCEYQMSNGKIGIATDFHMAAFCLGLPRLAFRIGAPRERTKLSP